MPINSLKDLLELSLKLGLIGSPQAPLRAQLPLNLGAQGLVPLRIAASLIPSAPCACAAAAAHSEPSPPDGHTRI
jgi:hypothetical protein